MKLKPNYNQQEKLQRRKLNQQPEQQAKQQPQQQQGILTEQPERKASRYPSLTAKKLKSFPGLAGLEDDEAQEITDALILLSQINYELFQKEQHKEFLSATKVQQPIAKTSNNGNSKSSNRRK